MAGEANDEPRGTSRSQPAPDDRRPAHRLRIIAWTGSIIGAAVIAFVTAYFTVLGNHVAALSTKPPPPGGPPVKVDAVNVLPSADQTRVFPAALIMSPQQLDALNSLNQTTSAYENWFTSQGAVQADGLGIQLIVEGNRDNAVQITDIQPILSCQPPLAGTLFYSPSAGANTSTQLLLNLDKPLDPPGYIASSNGNVSSGSNYFAHFTVSLTRGEQFTFQITASTTQHYCTFSLNMSVLAGGKTVQETVENGNKQFSVTALYNEDSSNPGQFARYAALYVGGVGASGFPGSGQNSFGQDLWLPADKTTYPGHS
jgi:hypothetical protein